MQHAENENNERNLTFIITDADYCQIQSSGVTAEWFSPVTMQKKSTVSAGYEKILTLFY
jgi:hypothetical protein